MENKTFKQFHKELSWSTRIYTLMVLLTIVFAYVFDAWNTNWVMTIMIAIAFILFIESFAISFQRHPKTWKTIRYILFLILLALLLIGFTN